MFKPALTISALLSISILSGCTSSIGQNDFTCPNLKKGGVCGGPRDVYELTNNRTSLENLTQEELDAYRAGKSSTTSIYGHGESGETVSSVFQGRNQARNASSNDDIQPIFNQNSEINNSNVTAYYPRSNTQQTQGNHQNAEVVPLLSNNEQSRDGFEQWPGHGEPLAPEPLAILEPAKVMRILVAAYTDSGGNLNMPGYLYVEVTPRRWNYGEAANTRPSRVVPLEAQRRTTAEGERQRQRSRGVDPLEVINPTGN